MIGGSAAKAAAAPQPSAHSMIGSPDTTTETTMRLAFLPALFLCSAAALAADGYAGQQMRDIKALSSDDVADLLAGRGMGLAKPAELNHYPGPAHLLEMKDQLGLSP